MDTYELTVCDGRFLQSFCNSSIFTLVSVFLALILGMGVALVLNQSFPGRGIVRTISLLPLALPTALMGLAWAWLFNYQYGIVNDILLRLGILQKGNSWL